MEGFMKPTTDFPFLLDNPRAWRTYLGGRMLDALHGDSNGEDGHFPEEWILSTVAARNAGREQFPEEGMSHLRGTDVTLDRKSTRLNSSHIEESRMPSSA